MLKYPTTSRNVLCFPSDQIRIKKGNIILERTDDFSKVANPPPPSEQFRRVRRVFSVTRAHVNNIRVFQDFRRCFFLLHDLETLLL